MGVAYESRRPPANGGGLYRQKEKDDAFLNACVRQPQRRAPQRAKFAKKVHKPPLRVNVINFELNGFNTSIWVPFGVPQTSKSCDALIHKIQVKISCMFAPMLP